MVDRPPFRDELSALRQSTLKFDLFFKLFKTWLTLMHASRHFEQNGTRDPSSTRAKTPLDIDSMAIYPTNPVIFHPLITL